MKRAESLLSVLVVDDTEDVLMSMVGFLENEGYSVLSASSAREALTLMETERFDVVVTDLEMPDINGLQLATVVKERYPQTSVALMSGWPGDNEEVAQMVGADRFFPKPMEWSDLTEFLRGIRPSA